MLATAAIQRTAFWVLWAGLVLAIAYYMLRGVRWLWFVNVGMTVLYALVFLLAARYVSTIFNLVALGLLLAAPTRRYFARNGGREARLT